MLLGKHRMQTISPVIIFLYKKIIQDFSNRKSKFRIFTSSVIVISTSISVYDVVLYLLNSVIEQTQNQ